MIDDTLGDVDLIINNYVFGAFTELNPFVLGMWRVLFIIFIALYGVRVMLKGNFSIPELVQHGFKIVIILAFATVWGNFSLFFNDFLFDFPNRVAGEVLSSSSAASPSATTANNTAEANAVLSTFWERGITVGAEVVDDASFRDVGKYLYALVIWTITVLLTGVALLLIVLSRIAVAVLLAVGPLFILALIFNISRNIFEGWFKAIVTYSLIPLFTYLILALILLLIETPLAYLEANVEGTGFVDAMGGFVLVGAVSFILLSQVMNITSGIGGGFALSTLGAAGAAARTISNPARATVGRLAGDRANLAYMRATQRTQKALTQARFGNSNTSYRDSSPASRTLRQMRRNNEMTR